MSSPMFLRTALFLGCLVFAQSSGAQLSDVMLKGPDKVTLWVKGATNTKVSVDGDATVDVSAGDDVDYGNSTGLDFDGRVDNTGRKPLLVLDPGDLTALALEIQSLITNLTPLTANSVTIDSHKTKVSAKAKDGFTTAKLGLSVSYSGQTTQGPMTGKLAVGATTSDIPRCTVCDASYAGVESFKQSLKGCGSLSGTGNATLDIAADIDDDGVSTLSYTDSDGVTFTGTLVQNGKKFTCSLDAPGTTALENALSDIIEDECGVPMATVVLGQEKCTGKPGKGGGSASFAFGVGFTAFDQLQNSATGKSAVKGTFVEVP